MVKRTISYNRLVGKPEGGKPFGKCVFREGDNKGIDYDYDNAHWIELSQGKIQYRQLHVLICSQARESRNAYKGLVGKREV
jgi:hypothetical protein